MNISGFGNRQITSSVFFIAPPSSFSLTVVASLPHTLSLLLPCCLPTTLPPPCRSPSHQRRLLLGQLPSATSPGARQLPLSHLRAVTALDQATTIAWPPEGRLLATIARPPEGHRPATTAQLPPSGHQHPEGRRPDPAPMPPLSVDLDAIANSGEVSILSNFVGGIRNLNVGLNCFDLNVGMDCFDLNVRRKFI
jgi:hypothetical protein